MKFDEIANKNKNAVFLQRHGVDQRIVGTGTSQCGNEERWIRTVWTP